MPTIETASTLVLRVRLSLAKMYLADLVSGADFGRMVDGRGNPFGSSAEKWIDRIKAIAAEVAELWPVEAASLLAALGAVRPCT